MLGHAVAKLRKIVMKVWWEGKRIYHIDDERLLGYGLLRGGKGCGLCGVSLASHFQRLIYIRVVTIQQGYL